MSICLNLKTHRNIDKQSVQKVIMDLEHTYPAFSFLQYELGKTTHYHVGFKGVYIGELHNNRKYLNISIGPSMFDNLGKFVTYQLANKLHLAVFDLKDKRKLLKFLRFEYTTLQNEFKVFDNNKLAPYSEAFDEFKREGK